MRVEHRPTTNNERVIDWEAQMHRVNIEAPRDAVNGAPINQSMN
jgi:hypothetical protein